MGLADLAGALAHWMGAPRTVIVTGAFCLAGALWFTLELPKIRAVMRPIYREMGLLPGLDLLPDEAVAVEVPVETQ